MSAPAIAVQRRLTRTETPAWAALGELQLLASRLVAAGRGEDAVEFARSATHEALAAFWAQVVEDVGGPGGEIAPCRLPRGSLAPDPRALASSFGRLAGSLPRHVAAYVTSSLYAALLPESVRAERGMYFTPPPVAERLLDLVELAGFDWVRGRVLDPAAGGGAFLSPVAFRMVERLRARGVSAAEILAQVPRRLAGIELDPFLAWVSHVLLEITLWKECSEAGGRLPVVTLVGDALHTPDDWEDGFDLVVGNPPYGRTTLPAELRARYGRSLYGHANLYGVFTDLAVRLAKPGGLIGYVTPTSFLGGKYFKNLRGFLAESAPPVALDFIEPRSEVFDGVLQETLLIVFSRARPAGPVTVSSIEPSTVLSPCTVREVGRYTLPAHPGEPWILPRGQGHAPLLRAARRAAGRLTDYGFRVSTGPLVWNRHKHQLTDEAGDGTYPLVWAESVLPGGEFRFQSTRRNHKPYFRTAPRQEHLVTREACVLVQRTTAKEQRRRLVAAVMPEDFVRSHGGAVVENHLNMIRAVPNSPVALATLAALLNSAIVDQVFRGISGSVAVSAYELESLPLPGPDDMRALDALVHGGGSREEFETWVAKIYGVAE